jgi:hypothetical protein
MALEGVPDSAFAEDLKKVPVERVYVCGVSYDYEGDWQITLITKDAEQAAKHIASLTGGDERIFEIVELGVECDIHV